MGYDIKRVEYSEDPDAFEDDSEEWECGCSKSNIWYDKKLDIYRCRNCGWCSL